ncbi:hypothetical protein MBM_05373 [Drepanopeziza brunnea f. sp. 'multigermtubi' MB_m1]|uniref:DUF3638 domain-containing protein n=1 Tax=Marssonina brunnea f. sp. multigermtubi (strain MB_m1) TaxID=1072389 RepID=K1XVY7_MARBU|nr:uncharacterized protein MBM_05373 [Drepanopeziza brunnea f. sp. 'multigermtubi' MB_m1]EKD16904.1 hypothetical protein MBM_05373 [Drepanopeziza brunnea f. sp. 'multigermtubi' MB_m1]
MASGGILLVQPESLLSFELLGVDYLLSKDLVPQEQGDDPVPGQPQESMHETGTVRVRTQQWLYQNARDILDESDEILSVRFELIYMLGMQQKIEFLSRSVGDHSKSPRHFLGDSSRHFGGVSSGPRAHRSIYRSISLHPYSTEGGWQIFSWELWPKHHVGPGSRLCQCGGPPTQRSKHFRMSQGVNVSSDGWVSPESRVKQDDAAAQICKFNSSPIDFLRLIISFRRLDQTFSISHMGKIVNGELLMTMDFEKDDRLQEVVDGPRDVDDDEDTIVVKPEPGGIVILHGDHLELPYHILHASSLSSPASLKSKSL